MGLNRGAWFAFGMGLALGLGLVGLGWGWVGDGAGGFHFWWVRGFKVNTDKPFLVISFLRV